MIFHIHSTKINKLSRSLTVNFSVEMFSPTLGASLFRVQLTCKCSLNASVDSKFFSTQINLALLKTILSKLSLLLANYYVCKSLH